MVELNIGNFNFNLFAGGYDFNLKFDSVIYEDTNSIIKIHSNMILTSITESNRCNSKLPTNENNKISFYIKVLSANKKFETEDINNIAKLLIESFRYIDNISYSAWNVIENLSFGRMNHTIDNDSSNKIKVYIENKKLFNSNQLIQENNILKKIVINLLTIKLNIENKKLFDIKQLIQENNILKKIVINLLKIW